jgi:hypothetical protein
MDRHVDRRAPLNAESCAVPSTGDHGPQAGRDGGNEVDVDVHEPLQVAMMPIASDFSTDECSTIADERLRDRRGAALANATPFGAEPHVRRASGICASCAMFAITSPRPGHLNARERIVGFNPTSIADGNRDVLFMPRPPASRPEDWLLGSRLKRRLLHVLLTSRPRTWSELELSRALGADDRNSVTSHFDRLMQLELVEKAGPRRYRVRRPQELTPAHRQIRTALRHLVIALTLEDDDKDPPSAGAT